MPDVLPDLSSGAQQSHLLSMLSDSGARRVLRAPSLI